ncbi:MAG: SCP2 sterol-binding domain-containing protein [Proteobacteria bacterium]|nr:SCP2 sterol-binding domain-containing protein [Pseudomonadota bacterium]
MTTPLLGTILNRGLARSPRARELCAQLAGRSVAVEARGLVRLRIMSDGSALAVARSEEAADATFSGGPVALARLAGPAAQQLLHEGAVDSSGDAQVARDFRELLQLLAPDPEEELSIWVGDVPAHQLGRLARAGLRLGARFTDTALANLAEYLGHERGEVVPRTEAEGFLRDVDALREDADRLQARLDLLRGRGTS